MDIKLIAKPNTWFDEGSEVYHYDSDIENPRRLTIEEYKSYGPEQILVRGFKNGEWDGELCLKDEFDLTIPSIFDEEVRLGTFTKKLINLVKLIMGRSEI